MAKLHLYSYKDNHVGAFRNPMVYDLSLEDLKKELKISLKGIKREAALKLADNALYCLGEFDQETGVITPCCEYCFDVGPIALEMAAMTELHNTEIDAIKVFKESEVNN